MSAGRANASIPDWWVSAYALDELTPDEREEMAAAISADPGLARAVEEARITALNLREALSHDVRGTQSSRAGRWQRPRRAMVGLLVLAAFVLLAIGGWLAHSGGWFESRIDTILINDRENRSIEGVAGPAFAGNDNVVEVAEVKEDDSPTADAGTDPPSGGGADAKRNDGDEVLTGGGEDTEEEIGSDDNVEVEGALDVTTVRGYVKRYLRGISWCYESHVAGPRGIAAVVMLDFGIAPNGRVVSPSVDVRDLANVDFTRCGVDKVNRWRFPQPRDGGHVRVRYSFRISGPRVRPD